MEDKEFQAELKWLYGDHALTIALIEAMPPPPRNRSAALGPPSTFRAHPSHFRSSPASRHSLAPQHLTRWATRRHRTRLFDHFIGCGEK